MENTCLFQKKVVHCSIIKKELVMNVKKMTNEEIAERINMLQEEWDQALVMDGSGELGGVIAKSFIPLIDELENELIGVRGVDFYGHEHPGVEYNIEDELPF